MGNKSDSSLELIPEELVNEQMLHAADQFYEAGRKLSQLPPGEGLIAPAVTCGVFALELYLKFLNAKRKCLLDGRGGLSDEVKIIKAESKKKGHKLSEILKAYNKATIATIDELYEGKEVELSYKHLIEAVQPYDDLFVDARYYYERKVFNNFNLDVFWNVVRVTTKIVHTLNKRDLR